MYMGFSDAQHSICANGDRVGPKSKLMSALGQKRTFLAVNCDVCFPPSQTTVSARRMSRTCAIQLINSSAREQ